MSKDIPANFTDTRFLLWLAKNLKENFSDELLANHLLHDVPGKIRAKIWDNNQLIVQIANSKYLDTGATTDINAETEQLRDALEVYTEATK